MYIKLEKETLFTLISTGLSKHILSFKVLHDGMFEAQTKETFLEVLRVKVDGIKHLDKLSRLRCDGRLSHFVAFSSAAAAYGNAGQTNYGYANSYMERVCEQRVADGLPGMAFVIHTFIILLVSKMKRKLNHNYIQNLHEE